MPSIQLKDPSVLYHLEDGSIRGGHKLSSTQCHRPLSYSGSLDLYTHQDSTPVIGREIRGLQIADLLTSPESDRAIKDLAVLGL